MTRVGMTEVGSLAWWIRLLYHQFKTDVCLALSMHYNSSRVSSSSSAGGCSLPAPWYSFPTIGWTTSSSCFFCVLNSSTSASWFFSSQAMASLTAVSIVSLSSELNLPPSFSLSPIYKHNTTQFNKQRFNDLVACRLNSKKLGSCQESRALQQKVDL